MAICDSCGLTIGTNDFQNEHNIRRMIVMALEANVAPNKGIDRYFSGRHALILDISP